MRGHVIEVGNGKILARMVSAKDGIDLAQIAITAHWDIFEEDGHSYLAVNVLTDDLDLEVARMVRISVDRQPVWDANINRPRP